MDIQKEKLIAEIENFKTEILKIQVVKVWAESHSNSDPFKHVILEKEDCKVWWMEAQAHQLWETWLAAKSKAVPEGFVLVPKEMPKSFDEGLYVYSNSISIVDECSEGFIPMSDINHAEVWKLVIEAQEQNQ